MEKLLIYKCDVCGYILEVVHLGKRTLVETGTGFTKTMTVADAQVTCCGQAMKLLTANDTDAAIEKHVPEITFDGEKVTVQVGSVLHPMSEEHLINWIVICYDNVIQRVNLKAFDEPKAEFLVKEDVKIIEAYAYCNLHGLWKATKAR